jgi:hypothetical protein
VIGLLFGLAVAGTALALSLFVVSARWRVRERRRRDELERRRIARRLELDRERRRLRLRLQPLGPPAAALPFPGRPPCGLELVDGVRPDLDSAASGLGANVPEAAVGEASS